MKRILYVLLFTFAAAVAGAQSLENLLKEAGAVRNIKHTKISPDGKFIAYSDKKNSVWLKTSSRGSFFSRRRGRQSRPRRVAHVRAYLQSFAL